MLNKVMVVDDSLLMHRMYDIIFIRYKGVRVVHAEDGKEALDLLAANPDTDLIVLDINMPVMNGVEFMGRLSKEKVYADIPVVVVTTEDKEGETLKALQDGARGYVKKPFHPSSLHTLIEQIFKMSS